MKPFLLREKLYMRLNCFIEQELAGNGFTDVAIYPLFFA